MLIGFGAFNVVEGIIDHHVLGIHHVNELVDQAYRIYFDVGFIIWAPQCLSSDGFCFDRDNAKVSPRVRSSRPLGVAR